MIRDPKANSHQTEKGEGVSLHRSETPKCDP
jgi:hypothetical protein